MIAINVSSNASALLRDIRADQDKIRVAVMRSLNRTADGVKTDAIREIRKHYNVTAKALRGNDRRQGAFTIRRATPQNLVAVVRASGHPLPLYGFAPQPKMPGKQRGRDGVSVSVRKTKRATLKGSFIARMRSGHIGVFMRVPDTQMKSRPGNPTKHAERIAEKYTSSMPRMFGAKAVQAALRPLAVDRFVKAMNQNLRFTLGVRRG